MKYTLVDNSYNTTFRFKWLVEDTEGNYVAAFTNKYQAEKFIETMRKDNGIVEFRNGDASLVYGKASGNFSLCITKCGEMETQTFSTWKAVENFVRQFYYFTDELVDELKSKMFRM